MKRNGMKWVIVAALAIGLGATFVQSQRSPRSVRGPGIERMWDGGGMHFRGRLLGPVVDYLGLSEDQVEAIREILQATAETNQPMHEQIRDLRVQLDQTLEAGGDAQTVGAIVLQIYDLRQQIRDSRAAVADSVLALLTPEQVEKVEAAGDFVPRRVVRGLHGLGLLSSGDLEPPD